MATEHNQLKKHEVTMIVENMRFLTTTLAKIARSLQYEMNFSSLQFVSRGFRVTQPLIALVT